MIEVLSIAIFKLSNIVLHVRLITSSCIKIRSITIKYGVVSVKIRSITFQYRPVNVKISSRTVKCGVECVKIRSVVVK